MQVLTDTYGRILTQHEPGSSYRTAVVWVPGDSRIDWDDASDQELITLLGKYGYNDALTFDGLNVTINDNGETEQLTWNNEAMDFTVDVDMFVNGEQNMFFRTVNDGSQDVTVLCDADGKAIHAPSLGDVNNVLFTVANNGTEIDTITSDSSISREGVSNACGGDVNVTALDAGVEVFLLVMGTHVQYCNAGDLTTTPSVTEWERPRGLYIRDTDGIGPANYLVDEQGRAIKFTTNAQISFYMVGLNNGQYSIDSQKPNGWSEIDLPFNGENYSNGSFEFEGVTYNCVNNVMSPVITAKY